MIRAYALDPSTLMVRHELAGIRSCVVTGAWLSDTRHSARLVAVDPGWADRSWVRVVRSTDDADEVMGTYCVQRATVKDLGGHEVWTLTLQGVLWSISEDLITAPLAIGAGTYVSTALAKIAKDVGRELVRLPGYHDARLAASVVHDVGTSRLDIAHELCGLAGARLDSDPMGRITVGRDVPLGDRAVDHDLAGTVIRDSTAWHDLGGESYNRSIVSAKDAKSEIVATADVRSSLGYVRARLHSERDMMPFTAARARQLARDYAASDSASALDGSVTVLWSSVSAGDIVMHRDRRWLVTMCDADLSAGTKKMSLAEA